MLQYLLLDTQAILGGRRLEISPDDYVLGAIQLYVDIMELFINILEIVGTCADEVAHE